MNIRKRLRYSYILMLLIPVVLMIISGTFIKHNYSQDHSNPPLPQVFLKTIYQKMANKPEDFLNRDFLVRLDSLSGYEGKINIYVQRDNIHIMSLENSHMGAHKSSSSRFDPFSSWDFYFVDGSAGKLKIVIFDAAVMKGMFYSGGATLLMAILALIMTNGLLSWFVAGSITTPLKILEKSALSIKNEDLDTPVVYRGKDEFLDVCMAFEEMRLRLKSSLRDQQKYEENRKELLSNISHDLKTPITAIKGYMEGIKDGIADTPVKMEKYIETVYSKSVLMNDLIDRLFLFSKLDLGKIQFNFQDMNISNFLRDICEELKFDYPDLKLNLNLHSEQLLVSADPIHIHRVVTNLMNNSLKYSGRETTKVTIQIKDLGDLVEVSHRDNGVGISRESLPHIFERFYRSDPARSSQSEGSGLGLSISSQIIKAHGGEMNAESSSDQGTTISFTLRKKR